MYVIHFSAAPSPSKTEKRGISWFSGVPLSIIRAMRHLLIQYPGQVVYCKPNTSAPWLKTKSRGMPASEILSKSLCKSASITLKRLM